MKIFDVVKKGLGVFAAESETAQQPAQKASIQSQNSKSLSNKRLLEELVAHFTERLEEESLGKRMIYPMSFNVLMHVDDYTARVQALPLVVPEVVAAFYEVIKSKQSQYPNWTAPATYWYFQFSACDVTDVDDDNTRQMLEPGRIMTTASLVHHDETRTGGNVSFVNQPTLSIKPQSSDINATNINMEALCKIDIRHEGAYRVPFDKTLNATSDQIEDTMKKQAQGYAVLSIDLAAKIMRYTIKDELVIVTGPQDTRQSNSICHIDSPDVQTDHLHIRHTEKGFEIAAFAPARKNSREIQLSNGNQVIWNPLANHSSILIDDISIRFDIL